MKDFEGATFPVANQLFPCVLPPMHSPLTSWRTYRSLGATNRDYRRLEDTLSERDSLPSSEASHITVVV